ncbi:MAG: hypothetical protein HQL37_16245 [Alphaproteobacteria bacterium]|nr:hypothetical protein [Alphaproteobacteria bacterium]
MSLPNRIPLEQFARMAIGDIAALPAEELTMLQEDIENFLRSAKTAREWLDGALSLKYSGRVAEAQRQAGKDTGTVRIKDGPVTVAADLTKRVDWDQTQLAALVDRIRAAGDDPAEYVEIFYKVSERKYTAWPGHIQTPFASARTVKVGKPSFTLSVLAEGGAS